jgi:hypothetical protein
MEKFFVPVTYTSGKFHMFNMWAMWQDLTASCSDYGHENQKGTSGNWTL